MVLFVSVTEAGRIASASTDGPTSPTAIEIEVSDDFDLVAMTDTLNQYAVKDGRLVYDPLDEPEPDPIPDPVAELAKENKLLKAQVQALSERSDFVEDCIAEIAAQVYQ